MKLRWSMLTLTLAILTGFVAGGCGGRGGGDGKTLQVALLENKTGTYVKYSSAAGKAALDSEPLPDNLVVWVSDPSAKEAYPIVTYTWLLCYKKYADKKKADALKTAIGYCLTEGQKSSEELGYLPLPESVTKKVQAAADTITGEGEADASAAVRLKGSGATFPAPLYNKWFADLKSTHKNIDIDYTGVGSGQGIKSVIDGIVDFGASDAAMTPEEIKKVPAEKGILLLPMTAGAIVLAYNVPEVKDLKLSREVYASIFLGKIKKWNDEAIRKSNPGVMMPDRNISVIVRSDSSGTTYVFTKHMATISKDFNDTIGVNKQPNWPVGTKEQGNEGITTAIRSTPGAIGYIEYSYAKSE